VSGVTPGLRSLLGKLTAYKVKHWGQDSSEPSSLDRDPTNDLNEAHVTSSLLREQPEGAHSLADILNAGRDPWDLAAPEQLHQVVVDIDHAAHLVSSSTPDHWHLYVEIPGGVPQSAYFDWLRASAKIGLLQQGYVDASIARGHSDLRLPWVTKADTPPTDPKVEVSVHLTAPQAVSSAEHGPESGRPQSFDF
jgi:hypothetical protein